MARDVIVIGAGGGGPVVAKELAARGLDVLVLEAGPRYRDPAKEWSHLENDANNPVNGYFRFGPADRSKPAWLRELPQNSFLWQVSGVGGTTQHYYGNSPARDAGRVHRLRRPDANAYDRAHLFPFTYRELIPYYEWVEQTLPVQTAAMGTKEQLFFRGAKRIGPAGLQRPRTSRATRTARRRTRSCSRAATPGKTTDAGQARPTRRRRAARSAASASRAATSRAARRATSKPSARPTTATCRWRSPPTRGRRAARRSRS